MAKTLPFVDDTNNFENALNDWASTIVPGPGEIVVGGADGPQRLPGPWRRAGGTRVIALGDSITAGTFGSAPDRYLYGNSWFTLANIYSNGQLRFLHSAATQGDTTTQMLTRLATDVLPFQPNYCVVFGGINDFINAVPLATIKANIQQIVSILTAAAITPILCAITPRGSTHNNYPQEYNAWLAGFAATNNLPFIDMTTPVVDPTLCTFRPGLSDDMLHPNGKGAKAMGQVAATALVPYFPPQPPYLTTDSADPVNLIVNGTMSGAGPRATSWARFVSSGSGTATYSVVADSAICGQWQQIDVSTTPVEEVMYQSITTGFAPGDRLLFAGRIKTSVEAGGMSAHVQVRCDPGATYFGVYKLMADATGVFAMEFTVPPGTSTLLPRISTADPGGGATGGTGTLSVAQLTLRNLTALGLA